MLSRNVERFRGGLIFQTHRLLYHSSLGVRVIKKNPLHPSQTRGGKSGVQEAAEAGRANHAPAPQHLPCVVHPACAQGRHFDRREVCPTPPSFLFVTVSLLHNTLPAAYVPRVLKGDTSIAERCPRTRNPNSCGANMAHARRSIPDSGRGVQIKVRPRVLN